MKLNNKQQGMTMIGMVIFMSFVAFFVYAGIRLGPIYTEYYGVVKAMKLVANKPGASSKSASVIKDELMKSFYTSYVDSKRVSKKHIKIIRSRGKQLQVKYSVQEPFIGNLDFLIHFNKTIPLN
ncbi:hypothetical protein MNBD_GAMMA01-462 [hydrothermal vent metagenome]|uniref:DUF4845 domain-containing protein n=1 Tax=hydrothermal vent metagenome TaxID=652676 RepID=A0A3B0V4R7_9ZZZZ